VSAGFGLHDLDRGCFNRGRQHGSDLAGDDERRFVVCARAKVMRPRLFFSWLLVVSLWHAGVAAEQPAPQSIILATTTSLDNSGLLAKILPVFTKETGITVQVLAQGTGYALQTAASDQADLVLAHDPEAEQEFIAEGHGLDRSQIAWNDFIVVGPRSDPAHIGGSRDAVRALAAIAGAQASFVCRGDKSGTDALEQRLWRLAGIDPAKAGDRSWYRDVDAGMGADLDAARAMRAYTITDRGTWLSFGKKDDLTVLVEGDPRLLNRYDVILLNPAKHPVPKQALARRLAAWLLSPEGQAAIGAYEVDGEQLFHPSAAFPK
jgi:tungstate transport system substrate-binding protein